MKYRKSKIYTRHGRIEGLDKLLNHIAQWEEVTSILPGEIHNVSTGGRGTDIIIRVQRTEKGKVKCVAMRTGRKQELVIITPKPEGVVNKIEQESWGR